MTSPLLRSWPHGDLTWPIAPQLATERTLDHDVVFGQRVDACGDVFAAPLAGHHDVGVEVGHGVHEVGHAGIVGAARAKRQNPSCGSFRGPKGLRFEEANDAIA